MELRAGSACGGSCSDSVVQVRSLCQSVRGCEQHWFQAPLTHSVPTFCPSYPSPRKHLSVQIELPVVSLHRPWQHPFTVSEAKSCSNVLHWHVNSRPSQTFFLQSLSLPLRVHFPCCCCCLLTHLLAWKQNLWPILASNSKIPM